MIGFWEDSVFCEKTSFTNFEKVCANCGSFLFSLVSCLGSFLGADFVWVNPFYDSPMDDNGYDVRDYYKVASIYGSMSDFAKLVAEAHSREMKVIIDLVLNHTSDENQWFINSENSIEPYTDYYIWRDPVDGHEPNNWGSFFSGPAWTYDEKSGQYYLHLFLDF